MSDQDPFKTSEVTPVDEAVTPSNVNPFEEKLKDIKSEDGRIKYETVDKALEALRETQTYIPELQKENGTLKEELALLKAKVESQNSVEDLVNRIANNQGSQQSPEPQQPAGLDEQAIRNLVQSQLESVKSQQSKEDNLNSVVSNLSNKFGDKATDMVSAKAKELGTTPEQLKNLSMENPALVLSLFNSQNATINPTTGNTITILNEDKVTPALPKPEKSLLQGGTSSKDLKDHWENSKKYTNDRLGIT